MSQVTDYRTGIQAIYDRRTSAAHRDTNGPVTNRPTTAPSQTSKIPTLGTSRGLAPFNQKPTQTDRQAHIN